MKPLRVALAVLLGLALSGAGAVPARAEVPLPEPLQEATVVEQLGASVDPNLVFTDENGQTVRLGDYFGDGRPVLLTLNYYSCAMLCSIQLNGLAKGLQGLDWHPGDEFRIVTVSIDPDDTVEIAAEKRKNYLQSAGLPDDAEWHFLVGDVDQVRSLANSVGFGYRYDPEQDQYAHAAAIMLLAPDATVSRYLYGIEYSARDLKFGLMEAAAGRVGSPVEKLLLSCFHYDESIGRYSPFAFGIMRLGGAVSVLIVAGFGVVLWRREFSPEDDSDAADDTEISS